MANHAADSTDNIFPFQSANSRWPDLYALLEVAPDADTEILRRRIRESYVEATANTDHRNIERRIHFQTMSERIIPQCRRILLDPVLRSRYDRELARHKAGDPGAQDYGTFVNTINNRSEAGEDEGDSVPGKEGEFAQDLSTAATQPSPPTESPSPTTPEAKSPRRVRTEERRATPIYSAPPSSDDSGPNAPPSEDDLRIGEVIAGAGGDSTTESITGDGITGEGIAGGETTSVMPTREHDSPNTPLTDAVPAGATAGAPVAAAVQGTATSEASPTSDTPATTETDALYASVIRPEGPSVQAHSTAKLNLEDSSAAVRAQRNRDSTRISVGEDDLSRRAAGSRTGRAPRVTSQRTQMLAIGICAALLILYILRTNEKDVAPQKVALRIAYASDMHGFMEAAESRFEATKTGMAVNVDLRPMDSRLAMSSILSGAIAVDAWIPSESLWSDRYNEVAEGRKARPISVARPIAISPCVLIARGDQADVLRKRFPGGAIPSWEALRSAVIASAPQHFGLTDPTASGAGAVSRYYMAHEWCDRHKIPWDSNASNNAALWNWLAGFENNVAGSAKLTSDMAKELALGTAGRYWWAIAYESDAIAWMNQGKDIDVFYLPQTNYAEHPLCYIDQVGAAQSGAGARAAFEQFLRSVPMQQLLIQNGLRPTEIEPTAAVPNNPFTNQKYKAHGIRQSGFTSQGRINYRILNALTSAWKGRFG